MYLDGEYILNTHTHTDDGQLVWVPHSQDPHAVPGDRHGAAAPGGSGGSHDAMVGSAAGGVPRPRPGLRDGLPVSSPPLPPSPLARSGCLGGKRPGAGSRSCPQERLAPPFPARHATWAVCWPRCRPRGMRTTWRAGPPLGATEGKEDEEIVVDDVVVQKSCKEEGY